MAKVEIPEEMQHFAKVLEQAAASGKYPANNWLEPDGINANSKSNCASMFRHLAEASCGSTADKHSGLHPLLHLACRALMQYTRYNRGIVHELDKS